MESEDIRSIIRDAIQEYASTEASRQEPAYRTELLDERKRREELEQRVNQLVEENRRSAEAAERAQRESAIRAELQRLGVAKVELAYRAVKDDFVRGTDGRVVARAEHGEVEAREYLSQFVAANPKLLPARIPGGSGSGPGNRVNDSSTAIGLDQIRPGMSSEEMDRVRDEISRVALQTMRGTFGEKLKTL